MRLISILIKKKYAVGTLDKDKYKNYSSLVQPDAHLVTPAEDVLVVKTPAHGGQPLHPLGVVHVPIIIIIIIIYIYYILLYTSLLRP